MHKHLSLAGLSPLYNLVDTPLNSQPRMKLRITCQTFFDIWHADNSDLSGIEDRAELFQAGDPNPVRFINDDQLYRIADSLLRSSVPVPMTNLGIRRSEFR